MVQRALSGWCLSRITAFTEAETPACPRTARMPRAWIASSTGMRGSCGSSNSIPASAYEKRDVPAFMGQDRTAISEEPSTKDVWADRPVVVVCGSSATGKTYLARELASVSGLAYLRSHSLRKEHRRSVTPSGTPRDRHELSLQRYAELGRRAAAAGGAIVEGTFRRRRLRQAFAEGYGDGPPPFFVECRAPAEVLRARAETRQPDPGRTAAAPLEVVERQRREFEPLDEVPAPHHLPVSTDRPLEEIVLEIEAGLAFRARDAG
jgi:predicted kinase